MPAHDWLQVTTTRFFEGMSSSKESSILSILEPIPVAVGHTPHEHHAWHKEATYKLSMSNCTYEAILRHSDILLLLTCLKPASICIRQVVTTIFLSQYSWQKDLLFDAAALPTNFKHPKTKCIVTIHINIYIYIYFQETCVQQSSSPQSLANETLKSQWVCSNANCQLKACAAPMDFPSKPSQGAPGQNCPSNAWCSSWTAKSWKGGSWHQQHQHQHPSHPALSIHPGGPHSSQPRCFLQSGHWRFCTRNLCVDTLSLRFLPTELRQFKKWCFLGRLSSMVFFFSDIWHIILFVHYT